MKSFSQVVFVCAFASILFGCSNRTTVIEDIDGTRVTNITESRPFLRVLEYSAGKDGLLVDGVIDGCRVDLDAKKADGVSIIYSGNRCKVFVNGAALPDQGADN